MSPSPVVRVVSAEVSREGAYLLTQRMESAVFAGRWEFPGGRVLDGESDASALSRAMMDRLGVEVEVLACVQEVTHSYPNYDLHLVVYTCRVAAEPKPLRVQQIAWVEPEAFEDYLFPPADERSVQALLLDES